MHFSNKSHKFNSKEIAIQNLYDNMRKTLNVRKIEEVPKIEEVIKIEEVKLEEVSKIEVSKIKINTLDKIDKNLYYFKKNLPAWKP